jgi:hypothetical protein
MLRVTEPPVTELSKYIFEALRKDQEFILYRGRSKRDASRVLVLSPVAEYPAPERLKRLEHEYSLREELDPAWAARPIAIARHWDRPVLVLDDPGGVPFDEFLAASRNASALTDAGGPAIGAFAGSRVPRRHSVFDASGH